VAPLTVVSFRSDWRVACWSRAEHWKSSGQQRYISPLYEYILYSKPFLKLILTAVQLNDNETDLTVPQRRAYSITPQLQMSTSGPAYNLHQTAHQVLSMSSNPKL